MSAARTTPLHTIDKQPGLKATNPCTAWQVLGGLALAAVAMEVVSDAWSDMLRIAWHDEESSQVLLVPFVVGWLVWIRRGRLASCRRRGTWVGPLLVGVGWLISTIGYHHAIQSFWHGGAVLVAVGCFLSVTGRDVLRRFLPAFIVLLFLVPVPGMARQQIAIPLQTASAHLAQIGFEILGYEVARSGNVLNINGVDVAVAEACNGMRMVFALVLVSFAFAFGTTMGSSARLLIIALSPLVAIACNVLRLIPTVWIYGNYPQSVASLFHDISGWLMLPIAFLVLLAVTRIARWVIAPAV